MEAVVYQNHSLFSQKKLGDSSVSKKIVYLAKKNGGSSLSKKGLLSQRKMEAV